MIFHEDYNGGGGGGGFQRFKDRMLLWKRNIRKPTYKYLGCSPFWSCDPSHKQFPSEALSHQRQGPS